MNKRLITLTALGCLTACTKSAPPAPSNTAASAQPPDAVQQKLQQYSGPNAANCGRLDIASTQDQLKSASDCALGASQSKHPFYLAYDMPGMTVGVAGNADAKLFTVQSQGSGSADLTSGDCPSQLRVANSGRVTCFAPGDMGPMGAGHGAGAAGDTSNPHAAAPKSK